MVNKTSQRRSQRRSVNKGNSMTPSSNYATPVGTSKSMATQRSKKNIKLEATRKAKKNGSFQYRSSLKRIIPFLTTSLEFSEIHLAAIEKFCPFYSLVDLVLNGKITVQSTGKSDLELANIIAHFNRATKTFDIGSKQLKLTREDVIKVFGVKGGNEPVITSDKYKDTGFHELNFNGLQFLKPADIEQALEKAICGVDEDSAKNVVALLSLYFLTLLLAPNSCSKLSWGFSKILSNVEKLNSLDWPTFIYSRLMDSIQKKEPKCVTGCVALIPFWFAENFRLTKPRKEGAELLCEKWDISSFDEFRNGGPITQYIETQMTQTPETFVPNTQQSLRLTSTEETIVPNTATKDGEDKDGGSWSGDREFVFSGPAIDLAADKVVWGDESQLEPNKTGEDFANIMEELELLKHEQMKKDSELEALKFHNARLMKSEKELIGELEQKNARIVQLEEENADLNERLITRSNESLALRKRLHIKGSAVQDLMEKLTTKSKEAIALRKRVHIKGSKLEEAEKLNEKLLVSNLNPEDQNVELEVQKVITQVAHAINDYLNDLLAHPHPERKTNVIEENVVVTDTTTEKEIENVCASEKVEGSSKGKKLEMTVLPAKRKALSLNERNKIEIENIGKRTRKEAPRRDSWAYGAEAEGKRDKKTKVELGKCEASSTSDLSLEAEAKGNRDKKTKAELGKCEARSSSDIALETAQFVMPLSSQPMIDTDATRLRTRRGLSLKNTQPKDRFKAMKHAKYLSVECKEKLAMIEDTLGLECAVVIFKECTGKTVLLEDIYSLLKGDFVSSRLINAYSQILMETYNALDDRRVTIFNGDMWKSVKSKEENGDPLAKDRAKMIDEPVENAPGTGLYLFPITTNGNGSFDVNPYHWILLVHNTEQPVWHLYNSMQSRRFSYNPFKMDAMLLKSYVEGLIRQKWVKHVQSDPKALSGDCTQNHNYEISEPNCPQQAANSNDCGTYVCYAMEHLAKREPIPQKIKVDEMLQFKASMVQTFVDRFDMMRLDKTVKLPRIRINS